MKKFFKRFSAAVLSLAVAVTAVVFDVPGKISAAAATEEAAAGGCSGHSDMTEWTDSTSLPTSGSYYLSANVAVSSETTITDNLTLCLNGYTIDAQNSSRIFYINGGTLTLCDCDGNGKLTGGNSRNADNNRYYGGAVYIETGNFNMYGGTISSGAISGYNATYGGGVAVINGGTFTMSGGTISNNRVGGSGGGVYVYGGRFIMTGGTISDNEAAPNSIGSTGGGVNVKDGSTFEMSGNSTISRNKASSCGGVSVTGNSTFTMSGNSIISDNVATGNNGEGGVYASSVNFTMNGGTISNNTANNGIGGVEINGGTFTMNGGTISGNNASYGGGVRVATGTFEMNGGEIKNNTATGTNNNTGSGGGVYYSGGTFTMNGGTISGNTASNKGGGVYANGSKFTMSGNSTISDNGASDGGGVYVNRGYKFKMLGGTISNNTATSDGGGVYVVGDIFEEDLVRGEDDDGMPTFETVMVKRPGGDLTINGKVDISGNKKGSSANNVYLGDGRTITIEENFDAESAIGVNTSATLTDCTNFADVTAFSEGATAKDISASFTADIDGQSIVYKDDKVQLIGEHNWGDWEIKTEPTTETTGTAERPCTKDSEHKDTVTLHVLTDTSVWTKDDAKHIDPTEESTGKDVYTSDYGEVEVTLDKLPHTHVWGDWTITKAPTETETGTAERPCTKDSEHKDTMELPALSDSTVWTIDNTHHVDPTEESTGKDVYTSDYGEVTVTLPKEEHTHTLTYFPEVPATETTAGVKEHWHCEECGKDFSDENGKNEETSDALILGKIQTEVKSGENAPKAELTTSKEELIDAVLTSEEQVAVNDGKDVKIILTVEDATESVSSEDKTAVESEISKLTDYILGQYIDVNLLIKIGNKEPKKITETKKPIKVTLEIPAGLLGSGNTYSVIRVHNGETTVLPDLDDDENTVTIETDRFSTYALVYSESRTTPAESGGSSDNNTTSESDDNSSGNENNTDSGNNTSSPNDNNFTPNESDSTDNNENPSTGVVVSLVPFALAVTFLAGTLKRKKK